MEKGTTIGTCSSRERRKTPSTATAAKGGFDADRRLSFELFETEGELVGWYDLYLCLAVSELSTNESNPHLVQ